MTARWRVLAQAADDAEQEAFNAKWALRSYLYEVIVAAGLGTPHGEELKHVNEYAEYVLVTTQPHPSSESVQNYSIPLVILRQADPVEAAKKYKRAADLVKASQKRTQGLKEKQQYKDNL